MQGSTAELTVRIFKSWFRPNSSRKYNWTNHRGSKKNKPILLVSIITTLRPSFFQFLLKHWPTNAFCHVVDRCGWPLTDPNFKRANQTMQMRWQTGFGAWWANPTDIFQKHSISFRKCPGYWHFFCILSWPKFHVAPSANQFDYLVPTIYRLLSRASKYL